MIASLATTALTQHDTATGGGTAFAGEGGLLSEATAFQLVRAAICRASLTACCGLPSQGRP
jgi:hypothetical protein